MRMLVIMNPKGGRGKSLKLSSALEAMLQTEGVDYQMRITEGPRHATEITREERENFDVVVAFGGDGTVNEVINGLVGSNVPIGVVPIGTGNDFARSCGIPLSLEKATKTVLEGKTKRIDLGIANGLYFGNVVGIGFDAYSSMESRKIQHLRGTMVYVWAVLKTLNKYDSIPMRIELDNDAIEGPTYLVSIGNGWSVGGGLQLTPRAVLDDGTFHVCHVRDIRSMKVVRNFLKLTNGRIDEIDEVSMYTARKVKIASEIPLPIHIDGEIPEEDITEVRIEMFPLALSVIGNWETVNAGEGVE